MKTSLLHATLLPLFLFGSALPENHNQCKESNPTVELVDVHANAFVTCPNLTGEEMTFKLSTPKNYFTLQRNNSDVTNKTASANISHHVNAKDNSTQFVLHNVTVDQMGLYTCEAQVMFPPPLRDIKEKPQTIVIVKENTYQQNLKQCDPPVDYLPMWVGLGVLTIYGLIMTYTAFLLRSRLTRVNLNKHDYMNMKPRVRRKKQGILHPAQMSWYSDNTTKISSCNLSSKRVPK